MGCNWMRAVSFRGPVPEPAKARVRELADHRVFVHHLGNIDVAVDTHRQETWPPAEECAVAGERGQHGEQRGIQPHGVHGPPVLARGQTERKRDIHQAEGGLYVEAEQPTGARFRVDPGDVQRAEAETARGAETARAAEQAQHAVDVQVVLDDGAVTEFAQRAGAQGDL